jgi:hypothetical protein
VSGGEERSRFFLFNFQVVVVVVVVVVGGGLNGLLLREICFMIRLNIGLCMSVCVSVVLVH